MAEEATHQYKLSTVISSSKSTSCYTFVTMENLDKAADNFQANSAEELDEGLFMEFENKIAIWHYFPITRNHYLALSDAEKHENIYKYYSDMKCRSAGGKNKFFVLFFAF